MNKRIILAAAGLVLVFVLFFFGKTSTIKKEIPALAQSETPQFNIKDTLNAEKEKLSPAQLMYVTKIENNISRGDVKNQTENQYSNLANFWKDSVASFIPYVYYLSEAAKLDNSEKKLTFAARLILENMKREANPGQKVWEAQTAADLFEKALLLDPDNEDLKVGLGSCYVYGEGMIGNAEQTMKGIQQLLQVVQKDSNNMQAQLVLGIGGVISNQYSKAIERLNKVVSFDPHNLEAVSWLADAYAAEGDKRNAVKWYEQSKHLVNNPEFSKEIDQRINEVQNH
ncbi:MAG TPA: tetratricopeptide repeat protein [Hanamia sp.]|nr:tetratricopeptide repeat protein [Hanamia sp.]